MDFECTLPGKELLLRQLVATADFLESNFAAAHCGNHRGLATDYPSLGVGRRQAFHGQQRRSMPYQKALMRHGDAEGPTSPERGSSETITAFSPVSPLHRRQILHATQLPKFTKL